LHHVAERGLTEIAEWILDSGGKVDSVDNMGNTPLLLTAALGYAKVARVLIGRGANPNAQEFGGSTVLHKLGALDPVVLQPEHRLMVDMLMAAGAEVNIPDLMGDSPICATAQNNNADITAALLKHGADPDFNNSTALRDALFFECDEVVDLLLNNGAVFQFHYGIYNETALHITVEQNYVHGVNALLNRGAVTYAVNIDGETPLIVGVRQRAYEAIALLLKRGANPNHTDHYGNTALSWAERRKDARIIELLKS
jgi:ankyrin repeat protein